MRSQGRGMLFFDDFIRASIIFIILSTPQNHPQAKYSSYLVGSSILCLQLIIMLAQIAKRMLKITLNNTPRHYFGGGGHHHEIDYYAIVTKNMKSQYYLNPNDVARRIARVIANFEGIQNVEKMNLNSQFWQLGLNELDYVELTVLVEEQFKIELPDDAAQKFKDVNDMVEFVARSYWAV